MSQYKILFKDDNLCFIALNTVYSIGEIMKDFVEKEIKNSNYNGIIIFDSLLSSLSYNDSNRFFCFKCNYGNVDYSKMSKSEQNFFKFLYFDILVHQKKQSGNLHVIVDDPFDSYDDIYVQDSIGIIVNLVNECIHDIETIDIFSHSMDLCQVFRHIFSNNII